MAENVIDPSHHPCLSTLPNIFFKAIRGLAAIVDAFLGNQDYLNKQTFVILLKVFEGLMTYERFLNLKLNHEWILPNNWYITYRSLGSLCRSWVVSLLDIITVWHHLADRAINHYRLKISILFELIIKWIDDFDFFQECQSLLKQWRLRGLLLTFRNPAVKFLQILIMKSNPRLFIC